MTSIINHYDRTQFLKITDTGCQQLLFNYRSFVCFVLFCFVLRHINLIDHLNPNQVKENKSENKFKGEVLGINDKL